MERELQKQTLLIHFFLTIRVTFHTRTADLSVLSRLQIRARIISIRDKTRPSKNVPSPLGIAVCTILFTADVFVFLKHDSF